MNYFDENLKRGQTLQFGAVLQNSMEFIENSTAPLNNQAFRSLEKPLLNPEQETLEFQKIQKTAELNEIGNPSIEKSKSDPGMQAKWEWNLCNHELVSDSKLVETSITLAPSIHPSSQSSQAPLKVEGIIQLERPLMYNETLGWNWHKVTKLPSIKVSIKFYEPFTNESVNPPTNLVAEFIAVKFCWINTKQARLTEIKLAGPTVMELIDGQATFSDLKFETTSYNNDGVKFHLVLIVSTNDGMQPRQKIIYSRISPPIFVDSRKSARDSNQDRCNKLAQSFFDPFSPDIFEKSFVKRTTKPNEEPINNNLEGLSQYFAASNIRNKVKHPIFLAVKFSNCVRLYYNSKNVKISDNIEQIELEIVENLQKQIWENYIKSKIKLESTGNSYPIENKNFILLVEEAANQDCFMLNKKISDYLEPLQNDAMHIFFNSAAIPSYFVSIQWQNLQRAYIIKYNTILGLKNTYMQFILKSPEEELDTSPCMRYNTTKLKKTDNGVGMDIEQGPSKSLEGSEPRLHKRVKKEFSDISSIDEERKSECSRLSIEQRLAEIKMEDDTHSSCSQDNSEYRRSYSYSHEARNSSLIDELKKRASDLVSVETLKTRSQTAETLLGTPNSLINKVGNTIKFENHDSTKSSIHSGISSIGGPIGAKGSGSLSHYMKNSFGTSLNQAKMMDVCPTEDQYMQPRITQANVLMMQQQTQQQQQQQQHQIQQLNSQCIQLAPVDAGKTQLMMNQVPHQFQFNPLDRNSQLIDNEKGRYYASLFQNKMMQSQRQIPSNLNLLNSNILATQQRYDSNYLLNNQLGGTPLLLNSNQNLISTATNSGLGAIQARSDPTKQTIVKAALDNINANMMLISKLMNESDNQTQVSKDRCNSVPQFLGYTNTIPTQQYSTMIPTPNTQSFLPFNNNTSGSMDKERCFSNPFPLSIRKNNT